MTTSQEGRTSTWKIDPVHSEVGFSVKHMMVSNVKGRFRTLDGALHIDEQEPTRSWVEAKIEAASIDTHEPDRDAHLRSPDFFDVEPFPHLSFRSTLVSKIDDERWKVAGDLTIRDVTKEVVLDTVFEGQVKDAYGMDRAAFTATTEISRKDFGLNWNKMIETGGVVVGDRVKIELDIAAVRQE